MKTQSAKSKGRRLQQYVAQKILEAFSFLTSDDVRSTGMGQSGSDVQLSQAAKKVFNFDVECKNTERLNVWQALKQLEERDNKDQFGMLVFKRNRSKVYACIEFDLLVKLIKGANENGK